MRSLLLAGIVAVGCGGAVQAATISQSIVFEPLIGYWSQEAEPLAYFNSALGTLTNVYLNFSLNTLFIGGGVNDFNQATVQVSVGTSSVSSFAYGSTGNSDHVDLSVNLFPAASDYVGTGSFVPFFSVTNSGNNTATVWTTFASNNSLVYIYDVAAATAVPEPASLGFLGLGVAGVAATRRRRHIA